MPPFVICAEYAGIRSTVGSVPVTTITYMQGFLPGKFKWGSSKDSGAWGSSPLKKGKEPYHK